MCRLDLTRHSDLEPWPSWLKSPSLASVSEVKYLYNATSLGQEARSQMCVRARSGVFCVCVFLFFFGGGIQSIGALCIQSSEQQNVWCSLN